MKIRLLNGLVVSTFVLLTVSANAAVTSSKEISDKKVFISIGSDAMNFTQKKFGQRIEEVESRDGISVMKIDESALPWLSMLMHRNFNRCGGFMLHDDAVEADNLLNSGENQFYAKNNSFVSYKIDQDAIVKPMIDQASPANILATISQLSAFQNRFYKGEFGKNRQLLLRKLGLI